MSVRPASVERKTEEILAEMIDMAGTHRGGNDFLTQEDAAKARLALTSSRRGSRQLEPLSRKFRRLTRELMIDETIQAFIKARVIGELTGQFKDTKVTCTLMRIASGNPAGKAGSSPKADGVWEPPSIHVHLDKLSDEQLKDFYSQGIRPKVLDVTPEEKAADAEE